MEFGVMVLPRLSLSVGSGYSRHKLEGQKSPFFSKEYLDSEFTSGLEDFFTVIPGIKLESTYFFLAVSYSIPLRGAVSASLKAGTTYSMGTFESRALWDSYHPILDRNVIVFGDLRTIGFHLGGGLDFRISRHLALSIEALQQMTVFDDFTGCETNDAHVNMGEQNPDLFPEFTYSITDLSLSGLSLQAGIKLYF